MIAVVGLVASGLFAPSATGALFLLGLCVVFFGCGDDSATRADVRHRGAGRALRRGHVIAHLRRPTGLRLGLAGGAVVANAVTTSRLVSEGAKRCRRPPRISVDS